MFELREQCLQSTAYTAVQRMPSHRSLGPFGWLSSSRLPLDSRKDYCKLRMQEASDGPVSSLHRYATSNCRFSLRATIQRIRLV